MQFMYYFTKHQASEKNINLMKGCVIMNNLRKGLKRRRLLLIALSLAFLLVGCKSSNSSNNDSKSTSINISNTPSVKPSVTPSDKISDKSSGNTTETEYISHKTEDGTGSVVYMTSDISPEGLKAVYEALNKQPTGKVAVKLSTGEAGGSYYLSPDLIKDLVKEVDGTIVECNTAYGGSRANTAMHMQVAEDHGFTAIANVDIMDAEGTTSIPIEGGSHLTEDVVGSHFTDYDFFVVLSHFKGHAMGGFGGAIKNISIGIASTSGKCLIHTAGKNSKYMTGGVQDDFLESMAEAAKGVSDSLNNGKNILYISVMNNLSIDCDCDSSPAEPEIHDIGILASLDPVALDQACVDLVYAAPNNESLVNRIESLNGIHTLEHAEEIGLGNRSYTLENIDD